MPRFANHSPISEVAADYCLKALRFSQGDWSHSMSEINAYRSTFEAKHGKEASPFVISDFVACVDTQEQVIGDRAIILPALSPPSAALLLPIGSREGAARLALRQSHAQCNIRSALGAAMDTFWEF